MGGVGCKRERVGFAEVASAASDKDHAGLEGQDVIRRKEQDPRGVGGAKDSNMGVGEEVDGEEGEEEEGEREEGEGDKEGGGEREVH